MKGETEAHIAKALQFLRKAEAGLGVASTVPEMAENAARDAYYAAFHAAKALIIQRTGKVHKTHNGVHAEFSRITKDEPHFDRDLRSFLLQAYAFKSRADYETDETSKVTSESARRAIDKSTLFVDAVRALIRT